MELIPINSGTIGGETVQTVNARELHEFLESGQEFRHWVKNRIEQYGFVEGQDFTTSENFIRGGKAVDYHISIDMGKELCMVERNEKGKQARLYFIECEKRAKAISPFSVPTSFREALLLAAEQQAQIEQQQVKIIEMKPKADFFDAVTNSKTAVDLGTVAKVLNFPGYGRNRLFDFLRDSNILMPDNIPYQKYVDAGYFRVIESKFTKPDGSTHVSFKTVVYQKGIDFIRKKLAEVNVRLAA